MIRTFECRSRRVVQTTEGTEIIKKYYLDPYRDQNIVLAALLGGVDYIDGQYVRRSPARDTYMPWCYCDYAAVDELSELQCSGGPSTGFAAQDTPDFAASFEPEADHYWGVDFYGIQTALQTIETQPGANLLALENRAVIDDKTDWYNESKQTTGCWISARFRPMICAEGTIMGGSGLPFQVGWGPNDISPFDVVDPQLIPERKFVSVPHGLFFVVNGLINGKPGCGEPIKQEALTTQAFATFSIRRLYCHHVPVDTIGKLMGKTNQGINRFGDYVFPPETLRFRGAEPIKRVVVNPDGSGNAYFDITYIWDVNLTYDQMYVAGQKFNFWPLGVLPIRSALGYVGWNRMLLNFESSPGNEVAPLMYYRVGSKEGIWQQPLGWAGIEKIRMQFPFAESEQNDLGFLKLFAWDAQ